jgi:hypothetical protein
MSTTVDGTTPIENCLSSYLLDTQVSQVQIRFGKANILQTLQVGSLFLGLLAFLGCGHICTTAEESKEACAPTPGRVRDSHREAKRGCCVADLTQAQQLLLLPCPCP